MVHFSFDQQEYANQGKMGVLNLIPKPGKDSRILKNLRPITLLNCDYKIIEKCIANRLTEVTEVVVHSDQKGFMPNRRINANIRKIMDIITYCENSSTEKEGLLLNLDLEKAFDKLSFDAIFGSLQYFNTADYLIDWIKILYTGFVLKIQNNGKFSELLNVQRGTHQGGVCLAQIFVIAMELIAIDLRANQNIMGIRIGNVVNILNQFADDTDVTLENDQTSLQQVVSTFEQYRGITGLSVSYDKTTVYRIGSLRKSKSQLYTQPSLKWSNDNMNILGITVLHDIEQMLNINYDSTYDKMTKVINSWKGRTLTLLGKINVINTLIASLFVYKMMVLPTIPKQTLKKINSAIRNFLWDNKKSKIAMCMLQASKKNGGLQLTDLLLKDQVLKISWIQILNTDQHTANIAYASMSKAASSLQHLIWRCNLHHKDVNCLTPNNQFWQDVLKAWATRNFDFQFLAQDQILWCNSYITVGNNPFFWEGPFKRGLTMLNQLCENQAWISQEVAYSKFGLSVMQLNSIKEATPQQWKRAAHAKSVFGPTHGIPL